jgi:amino acid transporter
MIGPRVYYAMAKEKMLFSGLGSLSQRFGTPAKAIVFRLSSQFSIS